MASKKTLQQSSSSSDSGWDPQLPYSHETEPIQNNYIHDYPNERFESAVFIVPTILPFVPAGATEIPHYGEEGAAHQPSVMSEDMGQTDSVKKQGVNLVTRSLGFYYSKVAAGSSQLTNMLTVDEVPPETPAKKRKKAVVEQKPEVDAQTSEEPETKKHKLRTAEEVLLTMIPFKKNNCRLTSRTRSSSNSPSRPRNVALLDRNSHVSSQTLTQIQRC